MIGIAESVGNIFSNLPIIAVIVASILPFSESRGAIPLGILVFGLNPWLVFFIAIISNILIVPIAFIFLDFIHKNLLKWKAYKRGFAKLLDRIQHRKQKVEKNYETYGVFALTILTSIPLPGTGALTGVLIAWLLKLKRLRSFLAICLGIIIAAIIVLALTVGLQALF